MMDLFNTISKQNTIIFGKQSLEKYQNVIVPYLLKVVDNEESFVVTDPEDVILRQIGTKLKQEGYDIVSINLRNPDNSNSWNPLYAAYEAYKNDDLDSCLEHLNSVATIIMLDDSAVRSSDPFWELSATDLFVGLALILFREATDENQINMSSVYDMAQKGFSRFGASTIIDSYLSDIIDGCQVARNVLSSVLSAPTDTRASILSVFYQKIRAFTIKDKFLRNLCANDISFEGLIASKTAIFICYEDENSGSSSLVKILLRQLVDILIKSRDVLKTNEKQYHVVVSNFLSIGTFPEIDRFISSCNNRHVNIVLDIYSVNAFYKLYGKDTAAFVFAYCSAWYITATREIELQILINRFLKITGRDGLQIKSVFDLMPNEVIVVRDGRDPKVEIISDIYSCETLYEFQCQNTRDTVTIFRFDDLVKEKKRDIIFGSDVPNPFSSMPGGNGLNVDDLLVKIDRKIAALEVNEKIEKVTKSGLKNK